MDPPDRELMARLARGDRDALGPLMERHHRRLYRIALGYLRNVDEAMDTVQEVFVKAYQNAGRWDPRAEVGPWLTRITINQAIDQYRKDRRRHRTEEPLEEGAGGALLRLADDEPSPERRVMGREVQERIGAALLSLPDRQRAVFVLRHYEEMSLDEIAATLEINLGSVKSSLHRALHRLRARLGGLRS